MPVRRVVRKLSSKRAIDTPMLWAIALVVINAATPATIRVFVILFPPW